MATTKLKISGMSCGHCVSAVSGALKGVEGVGKAEVAIGSAVVEYDPAKANLERLRDVIEDQGYAVTGAE